MTTRYKSKTLATWLALVGGGFGIHRFYVHGWKDALGWLHIPLTLLGVWGVLRVRQLGQDDPLSWLLLPVLGLSLAAAMLNGIVDGLQPDERWNQRHNQDSSRQHRTGWGVIIGIALCLMLGAGLLMSSIAFSGQRYFEYQIDEAQKISQ